MKALIAKNDGFKTVGFRVTSNGKDIFKWGVAPDAGFYFIKEISTKDWETDIIALVQLSEKLRMLQRFHSDFFSIVVKNETARGLSYNFQDIDAEAKKTESAIENIISNII